ncbi:MAG: superoxide dismutase [Fe] [Zetaproteobacteria bacterium CG06_land_8_20_14_3_00_59_53]|nr:MAG: superoxide dismutase [Zetaproteobacteria bacterium CG2_30_59_37]PIO90497.1 MAG: superoxide dismutase [Fe] [Zetaproteobacteria bacterium CG23_combo_of_CG06-09_8_20_14_all_59_86]PIQ65968.1 MAG: superoxide dismutase [Fe] [Zetaproteobacteria bacterium CG11_big_fil_rev_8_21_14_0_20_59_439]PIU71448.1 MAG: superoxide dismutase [Fe] [Zetaproteobacteria bacterium CG06_land_8_20_14_3_00_59_53]PIU97704.1 MAG: superoxide dismutase [Fe] [Zetaproteobacteria bacterium CG03_land_8_20_14_0_80_59_51]PIY
MTFTLPALPYETDALAPMISKETLELHYGKHHAAFIANLNRLVVGTIFEDSTLESLICKSDGALFNHAAQAWNHQFYWQSMTPRGSREPKGELLHALVSEFGSFAAMKQEFTTAAAGNFGSGWTWLVMDSNKRLSILNTGNADNPMREGLTPLLCCDVWEHAYYIDYRNVRADYIEAFWKLLDWKFAADNFSG